MNIVLIFIAALALGPRFHLPRETLLVSSTIACLGFACSQWLTDHGATAPEAAFAGAFVVAMSSEFLARFLRVPSPVLSIPGIIPLVPGSVAYRAVTHLVKGEEVSGVGVGTNAVLTAVGIASGLLLASALARQVLKPIFRSAAVIAPVIEPPPAPEQEKKLSLY